MNHPQSTESEEKHSERDETDLNGHSRVILKQGFHNLPKSLKETRNFVAVNSTKLNSSFIVGIKPEDERIRL